MNKTLIFLIISTSILVLSAVVICVAPIINDIQVELPGGNIWKPSNWRNLNCQIFADKEKSDTLTLDEIQQYKNNKNLCYRQKAMYALEYSAFIIDAILAFICADLTLLHYLNVGKDFEKKTGIIGIISGIIGCIITLVYACYSGYIFNNDVAYGILDDSNQQFYAPQNFHKLYPNGALYKWDGTNFITVNANDKSENAEYLLYKNLGEKQYNYNTEYYKTYMENSPPIDDPANPGSTLNINGCNIMNGFTFPATLPTCDYLFYTPETDVKNKYIYDRWLTALVLSIIIVAFNLGLFVFGFLLCKSGEEVVPSSEQTPIIYKK